MVRQSHGKSGCTGSPHPRCGQIAEKSAESLIQFPLAGKSIAENIDPAAEDEFWKENYRNEPYYDDVYAYQDYGPAYRAGYSARSARGSRTFEEAEPGLRRTWENINDQLSLTWDRAKAASRAAWDRVKRAMPGDADGDGK